MKKTIKILIIASLILIFAYFLQKGVLNYKKNTQLIKKIESEKEILKQKIQVSEKKIKKIQKNKQDIINKYKFDLENTKKKIEKLSSIVKIKRKTKIIYKTRIITKDTPKSELWNFSLNLHSDFKNYIKLDLKERAENKKALNNCLNLNLQSEKIIEIQQVQIKSLKRSKKKIIFIAILTVIAGIIILK